jgi:16S rRNA (cytidine1402-2'-O)-methyltransferase
MPGTLIVCATPIGNLGDLSARLADTLGNADVIYAEDTRRTAKLLNHLGLSTPMKSFFAGNEKVRLNELAEELSSGHTVALVSDAGTPVVSDPGASAVATAVRVGAVVTAIPGPSAVTTALAASGFNGDRFVFAGFLPRKGKDRSAAIEEVVGERRTIVLFAAPSRVDRDLSDLAVACQPERRVVVARELTKLHEELWRGSIHDAAIEFSTPGRAKGEFTIVIDGAEPVRASMEDAITAANSLIGDGSSTSDAVREVASTYGVSRRELYDRVLAERR